MRRWIVLGVLVTIGALSLVVTANQQQGDMVVEVEQLEDNLFVLRGAGGNTAVFVTSDGVAVVDTMMAGWGRPILDAIKQLTTKPVTMIINTHTHFDHVSGNVEFPATVEVVAHENTQRLMHEWNLITGFNFAGEDVFAASDGKGIATRTFRDRMTLGSGAGTRSTSTTSVAATPEVMHGSCSRPFGPCTPATCSRTSKSRSWT